MKNSMQCGMSQCADGRCVELRAEDIREARAAISTPLSHNKETALNSLLFHPELLLAMKAPLSYSYEHILGLVQTAETSLDLHGEVVILYNGVLSISF